MKVIVFVVLALIAVVSCDPVQISNNNVGDVITVGISANADIANTVNQDIVNVIVGLINQNADISRLSVPLAEAERSDIFKTGVPLAESEAFDNFSSGVPLAEAEFKEISLIGAAPPAENLENHFIRFLPSGIQN
ncbi:unnamed protein product [Diamesa serratosioi]